MGLNIDITKQLELLDQDSSYITQIIKLANQNWCKHTLEIKELVEATLEYVEEKSDGEDKNYERAYVKTVICMQWYYLAFSRYKEGTKYALKVYAICESRKWDKDMMRICNILLVTYMKQGLFEKAIDYGVQGIEIAKRYEDVKAEATLILNMMQLYIELKEYDKALQLIKYLEKLDYEKDEKHLLFIESALAEIKLYTHHMNEAMSHCERAYTYALNQEDTNAIAEVLYIRGQIKASYNQLEKAKKDFDKCMQLAKENDYKELIIRGIISWSEGRLNCGNIEEVEERLMAAVKLADEINTIHLKVQAYEALEKLYSRIGNWKEAYHMIKTKENCTKERYINKAENLWLEKLEQKTTSRELQIYKRLYQQIRKISKVGQNFTANLEIDEMIDLIYKQVNELIPADVVGMGMRKKNGEFMYKAYSKEGEVIEVNKELYDRAICLGNMTLYMDEDILINDGDFSKYFTILKARKGLEDGTVQSAIFTKLKIEDVSIGVIGIGNYKKNAYTKNDLRSVQILGSYLAVALRNADLFNEIEYLAMYDTLTDIYNRGTVLKLGKELFRKNRVLGKKMQLLC